MKHLKTSNQRGFTIIELMIATLVFSIILIVITAGIIQFTNTYYKGVTSSTTQGVARAISDDIIQDIQFSPADSGVTTTPGSTPGHAYAFCAGGHLYTYQLGQQVSDAGIDATHHQAWHALIQDTSPDPTACNGDTPSPESMISQTLHGINNPSTEHELLDPNMRLANLTVTQVPSTSLYTVTVRVVYGDDDLLTSPSLGDNAPDAPDVTCKGTTGSQFCAVSELTTTVEKRL